MSILNKGCHPVEKIEPRIVSEFSLRVESSANALPCATEENQAHSQPRLGRNIDRQRRDNLGVAVFAVYVVENHRYVGSLFLVVQ